MTTKPGQKYSFNISKEQLLELEKSLGYFFNDKTLLQNALRHSSIKQYAIPFERLEFLGDRILGIVVAEYLYSTTKGAEGGMAKMHSAFVCAEACYEIALSLEVNTLIKTAGKNLSNNKTVLADAMEAILGAIFTDSNKNYQLVEQIILRLWQPIFDNYCEEDQEPKTQLQEIVQSMVNETPTYTLVDTSGPKHQPIFTIKVSALGFECLANGTSKKEAETQAARLLLKTLKTNLENHQD